MTWARPGSGGGEPVASREPRTPGFADPAGERTGDGRARPGRDLRVPLTGRPPYDAAGARVPLEAGAPLTTRPAAADGARRGAATRPVAAAGRGRAGAGRLRRGAPGAADGGSRSTRLTGPPDEDRVGRADHPALRWRVEQGAAAGAVGRSAAPTRRYGATAGRRRGAHARPRPATAQAPAWAALRPEPVGSAARRRSWSALGRRGVAALGTGVAVVLAAVTGIAWAGAGPAASPGRPVAAPSAPRRRRRHRRRPALPARPGRARPRVARQGLDGRAAPAHSGAHLVGPAACPGPGAVRGLRCRRRRRLGAGLRRRVARAASRPARGPTSRRRGLRAAGVRLRVVQLRVVSATGSGSGWR